MSTNTSIAWCDATWTPLRARVREDAAAIAKDKGYASLLPIIRPGKIGPHCEHVSAGCEHCYSETNNHRCLPTNGTGLPFDRRSRDLVELFLDDNILTQPLRWRTPKRVFVCSQTDLFGEWVTEEHIDRIVAVMALCPQHTFQVLTKRPERMRDYILGKHLYTRILYQADWVRQKMKGRHCDAGISDPARIPMKWVHLGVSVEDQQTADERIPKLLETPAAIRWVSYEPGLGPINFTNLGIYRPVPWQEAGGQDECPHGYDLALRCPSCEPRLDWLVVGGESGPGARPFNIQWARDVIAQCKAAGVPAFCKQLGAFVVSDNQQDWIGHKGRVESTGNGGEQRWRIHLNDRKGGDWNEWSQDLKVREFPK